MKYRVIIADDEPKILQLIKLLGKWEIYSIEIVDECHDGQETLESIKKNKPDFVLSDIKMPDLDGLELIQESRKAGIDCLFVLLSGFRHFEYARNAIALNVVDYLLKPVDEEQLNRTLEKVCLQIKQKREEQENHEELQRIREKQDRDKLALFWRNISNRQYEDEFLTDTRTEELCNSKYSTEFTGGYYQILMIFTNISGVFEQQNSLFQDNIERFTNKYFGKCALCYYYITYMGCFIVLNFASDARKQIKENIPALYYSIRDMNEIYGELHLNIGISNVTQKIHELKKAYLQAQAAEWGRLIMMRNGVLEYSQVAGLKRVDAEEIISSQEMEKIKSCIKYLRREETGELFQCLFEKALRYNNYYPGDMAEVFFTLIEKIMETVSGEKRRKLHENCFFAYLEAATFSQLIKNVYLELDKFMLDEQKKMKTKAGKPISEAVHYIHQNYARAISLDEVAEFSNVSAAYLSKLFKEELEVGFTEYLTQIRLEESEKLLADTNMSVKDIAAAVGYPDEKYYSKLFKKITGIKPTEYRKIYG